MERIFVQHVTGDRFTIDVRTHQLVVDQPGSGDAGPTPTELFVASLAGCAGFFAHRFLARHGVADAEIRVTCDFDWADDHSRVSAIRLKVEMDHPLSNDLRTALERVLDRCTVKESIRIAPTVAIEIATRAPVSDELVALR